MLSWFLSFKHSDESKLDVFECFDLLVRLVCLVVVTSRSRSVAAARDAQWKVFEAEASADVQVLQQLACLRDFACLHHFCFGGEYLT